ncbi:uncharacterized protein VP01_2257g1 [Puccinia sorghi]|uniref:HAT C-terminal dimerisation domain-containing protein n=1 Tax=Puccinia sorghi TaxID=27349 RepID=A0A0L6V924_9BASI|nr:uncharacterized protein VP01_2257g1 [Puccinia sorghi]
MHFWKLKIAVIKQHCSHSLEDIKSTFITEEKKNYIEKDSNSESESSNQKQHKPNNPTLNQFDNELFRVQTFPLAGMAPYYIGVPATSAPSEQVFLKGRHITTWDQALLEPHTVQELSCVKQWYQHFGQALFDGIFLFLLFFCFFFFISLYFRKLYFGDHFLILHALQNHPGELLWSFTQYEHNLYQVFRLYAGIRFLQNTHKPGGRRNLFSSLNYLPPSSQVSHYVSHLIIIFIHLLFFLLALLFIFGYMKLIINYLPPSSQRFATVTGISRSRDTQVYLEQNISSLPVTHHVFESWIIFQAHFIHFHSYNT